VRRLGYEVSWRPSTTPASTSTHGPWQIAATGLPASKNERMNLTTSAFRRSLSAPTVPPGMTTASYSLSLASGEATSTQDSLPGPRTRVLVLDLPAGGA